MRVCSTSLPRSLNTEVGNIRIGRGSARNGSKLHSGENSTLGIAAPLGARLGDELLQCFVWLRSNNTPVTHDECRNAGHAELSRARPIAVDSALHASLCDHLPRVFR